jgi:hypothetical protein
MRGQHAAAPVSNIYPNDKLGSQRDHSPSLPAGLVVLSLARRT